MPPPKTTSSSNFRALVHTSETMSLELEELMGEVEGLRAAYEQYFLGIERKPPTQRHSALKKKVSSLQHTTVKQTAVKFRAQTLHNKLLTYERLWARTLKEIEDGTYRRDLFKARLHTHKKDEPKKDAAENAEPARADGPPPPPSSPDGYKVALSPPGVAAIKPASSPPTPQPANAAAISDGKLRAVYDAYITAKKRCNEDVSKLSFDVVATTLRKQVPALMKQHNAKGVEFKVVIKDGKAVLRALPKE